jgi:hypothetical protein
MILKDFHFQRMEAFYFDKQLSSQNRQNFSQRQQQPSLSARVLGFRFGLIALSTASSVLSVIQWVY